MYRGNVHILREKIIGELFWFLCLTSVERNISEIQIGCMGGQ